MDVRYHSETATSETKLGNTFRSFPHVAKTFVLAVGNSELKYRPFLLTADSEIVTRGRPSDRVRKCKNPENSFTHHTRSIASYMYPVSTHMPYTTISRDIKDRDFGLIE
jgi:hypothetical protein